MTTHLSIPLAGLFLAGLPAWALSDVTLHNLTHHDLIVTRAQGPGREFAQVVTRCPLSDHRWCPAEPRPMGRRVGLDTPWAMDPGRPPHEYWLKAGDSVSFLFDESGDNRRAEVFIHVVDWQGIRNCHGLLVYRPSQLFPLEPLEEAWVSSD